MIKIYKLSDENYLVKWKKHSKPIDSQTKLILFLLVLDVELDEIEHGLLELIKNDHNYLEFGIWKKFVYSKRM